MSRDKPVDWNVVRIKKLEKALDATRTDCALLRREVECLRTARDVALRASVLVLWRPPPKP